jgi:hypothetical protein
MGLRSVNSTISFAHLPLTSFDLGDATIAVRQLCVTNVGSARPAGFSRSSSINPSFRVDQNPSSLFRPRFGIGNNSGTSLGTITSGAADPARFSATQAFTMVTATDSAEVRAISQGFVYTPVARTAGTTTIDRFSVGGQSSSTDRLGFEGFIFVAAAWNRALSVSEMAAVDANIWQLFAQPRGRSFVAFGAGAGGTTTSTSSGAWTVRNSQSQTSSGAWTVRNSQSQTSSGAWTVRNSQSQTSSGAWTVRNSQSQTSSGAWTVRNSQNQTFAGSWSVNSSVTTAFGTWSGAWTVRNGSTDTESGSWTIRNQINTATLPGSWTIRGQNNGATFPGSWSIRNSESQTQPGAWTVRNTQTATSPGSWTIRASINTATFPGSWVVRNNSIGSYLGSWSVQSDIPEQISIRKLRGFIANVGSFMG